MKFTQLLTALMLTTMALPSSAGWFSPKEPEKIYVNKVESADIEALKLQTLSQLQQEMVGRFSNIEQDLQNGNFSAALGKAKQVLDTVRVKTGIDPKIRIQESFLVATKFSDSVTSFASLTDSQKIQVMRTISDFRGGLYMDLMNLSKRTTLLYIKAFQGQLEQSGGLTKEDKNKIINDLVKASLVPMPVEDKSGKKIFVFDEDVANEDHTYLFNRELKMFLLENRALQLTEDEFENLKSALRNEIISSNGKKAASSASSKQCMADADQLKNKYDRNSAFYSCFNKYYGQTTSMKSCIELADYIENTYDENSARKMCYNKFNQ